MKIKVIVLHGNGNSTPQDNWIPYVKRELEKLGVECLTPQMPDVPLCRSRYWLPKLKDELHADENTILIGHSTGALAAMRYAEQNKILGSVLIGAMHTDLGIENEKLSGYFDGPWNWEAIKNNQNWIVQFASQNDPWIPIAEARFVHEQLGAEYHEYTDKGHFGGDYYKAEFPELIAVIKEKINHKE